jgi:hypothetical protein
VGDLSTMMKKLEVPDIGEEVFAKNRAALAERYKG